MLRKYDLLESENRVEICDISQSPMLFFEMRISVQKDDFLSYLSNGRTAFGASISKSIHNVVHVGRSVISISLFHNPQ